VKDIKHHSTDALKAIKELTQLIKQSLEAPEKLKMRIGSIVMVYMAFTLFWRLLA
jgi:hypothetical protein